MIIYNNKGNPYGLKVEICVRAAGLDIPIKDIQPEGKKWKCVFKSHSENLYDWVSVEMMNDILRWINQQVNVWFENLINNSLTGLMYRIRAHNLSFGMKRTHRRIDMFLLKTKWLTHHDKRWSN